MNENAAYPGKRRFFLPVRQSAAGGFLQRNLRRPLQPFVIGRIEQGE
ncbi:hypothetical protein HMPREF3150_00552, partial [Pseudomonas aeruginosa]